MIQTLSTPMTLSTPIADNPVAPTFHNSRDRLYGAGSALGRAVTGFAFIGVLAATSELLGPAGLAVTSILAALAIGAKFSTAARRRHQS